MKPFQTICHPSCRRVLRCVLASCRRDSSNRAVRAAALAAALAALAAPAGAATNRLVVGFAEYSLSGNRLEVADIADPARPLPVCHFDLVDSAAASLSISNATLHVLAPAAASPTPAGRDGPAPNGGDGQAAPDPPGDPAPNGRDGQAAPGQPVAAFDIADIFAPVRVSSNLVASVTNGCGLVLSARERDGVRIARAAASGPIPATHCVTDGPALAIAAVPGGFAVALGTRGYALYSVDGDGLVALIRQWPLETGAAVSATYNPDSRSVSFDCQEGGVRTVAASHAGAAPATPPHPENAALQDPPPAQ